MREGRLPLHVDPRTKRMFDLRLRSRAHGSPRLSVLYLSQKAYESFDCGSTSRLEVELLYPAS